MIQLTKTEALFIEEVLQEMLSTIDNEEIPESKQDLEEALNIIRSCNEYSEEEMITLEEGYTKDVILEEGMFDE